MVCKTSIPGSNPGGASKTLKKTALFVPATHKRADVNGLELRLGRYGLPLQATHSFAVVGSLT
jgi:hypothetical protein